SYLAAQGKHLGSFAFGSAGGRKPVGAAAEDARYVGEGLDVVEQRGVAPQPGFGGIGWPGWWGASLAHDRRPQRRLLPPHQCPGTNAKINAELKWRREHLAAQYP